MKIVNSFEEVRNYINQVRGLCKGFLTNFYPEPRKVELWISHHLLLVIESEDAILFLKKNDGFTSVLYCATNLESLNDCLALLPHNSIYIVDQIVDARTDKTIMDVFTGAGFAIHKSLVRMSKINNEQEIADSSGKIASLDEDVPTMYHLLHAYFDKFSEQLPTLEELHDFVEAQHVIVHRVEGEIAGFIIYDQSPSTLYLRYWLVNPNYRNQGVGSILFKEYSRRGRLCKRHILWVMEDNANAIVRYKHYGYNDENMKNYVLIKRRR